MPHFILSLLCDKLYKKCRDGRGQAEQDVLQGGKLQTQVSDQQSQGKASRTSVEAGQRVSLGMCNPRDSWVRLVLYCQGEECRVGISTLATETLSTPPDHLCSSGQLMGPFVLDCQAGSMPS